MNIGIPIYKWGIDSQSLSGIETHVEDYFFREIAAVIKLFERAESMDGGFQSDSI